MFEFRAFPSRSGACAAGSTVRSVLVTGSCVCVFQPWPQNYPELLLHMKPLTPQQLYPMPFPPAPVQTPLWTVVGAVPLLADGNSKRLGGVDYPSQAMVLHATGSLLSAGDTGTIGGMSFLGMALDLTGVVGYRNGSD